MRNQKSHPQHKHKHKKKENHIQYVDENNEPRDFPHEPKARKSYFDEHKETHSALNVVWVLLVCWGLVRMSKTYQRIGYIMDMKYFWQWSQNWQPVAAIWIGSSIATMFTASIFEYINNRFEPLQGIITILHICSVFGVLTIPTYFALDLDINVLLRGALFMHLCVLMMKMHSYFMFLRYKRRRVKNMKSLFTLLYEYLEFIFFPTLIYEDNFPRSEKRNWGYILSESAASVAAFFFMYTVIEEFVSPVLEIEFLGKLNLIDSTIILAPATLMLWILGFYCVFHSGFNAQAELMRFADREFYLDWWNATAMSEFWRLWNRPVYKWMTRHIYIESMRQMDSFDFYSKKMAAISTQIVTAVIHEVVMIVAFKVFKPTFFIMILVQIPYGMYISELFRGTRTGNIVMWVGLMAGFPILEMTYTYFYALIQSSCCKFFRMSSGSGSTENPNADFDPKNFANLPYFYIGLTTAYILFTLFWLINTYRFRKQKIHLQWFMLMVPAWRIITSILAFTDYFFCSTFGKKGSPTSCATFFTTLSRVSGIFDEIFLYFILTLLSFGYYVTRTSFYPHEKRTTLWNLFWMAICLLAATWSSYFLFPLLIMYIVVLGRIFGSTYQNIKSLYTHLILLEQQNETIRDSPTSKKLRLFKHLQYSLAVYILGKILVLVSEMATVFIRNQALGFIWIEIGSDNLCDLAFIAYIYFIFRSKDFGLNESNDETASVTDFSAENLEESDQIYCKIN
eukprot:gene6134-10142_t